VLKKLQKGDALTVRLDRLGRSLAHLVKEKLEARGIGFETLVALTCKGVPAGYLGCGETIIIIEETPQIPGTPGVVGRCAWDRGGPR
jgi:hypothetical protein